jgi:L-serine dehydratase
MAISVFDIFKVGIGPSSSHTVGPMRAAKLFAQHLIEQYQDQVTRLEVRLHGSLGSTGKGHGSDKAILLGLVGDDPDTVNVDTIDTTLEDIRTHQSMKLMGKKTISFIEKKDLLFYRQSLPLHANGMVFKAFDKDGPLLLEKTYYSVGGGFVLSETVLQNQQKPSSIVPDTTLLPMPFQTGKRLLELTQENHCSIAEIMRINERHWQNDQTIDSQLLHIWDVMRACVRRGLRQEGILPGGLKVKRRAPGLYQELCKHPEKAITDQLRVLDWVNLYALAVNEENAAGGRVVTAPTNGAAGIIPAVLHYYYEFVPGATQAKVIDFLLTAGAIGMLYKENASISGAEVGCQGEVGVACSMAAGALCAVMGGDPTQVENAAEIGMEHHLGLTCDPVGGLVQIPCIERNAVASVKAINAARMALRGDGKHHVSLDQVIKTMWETGQDMKTKYKETARGGLALNIVAC